MSIRLTLLEDPEMNPDGDIFESEDNPDCTLAELRAEISRILPGVPEEEISIFTNRLSDRLTVMRLC